MNDFFPGKGEGKRTLEAQKVCTLCPVRAECEDYRERTGSSDGLWGGRLYRLGSTKG